MTLTVVGVALTLTCKEAVLCTVPMALESIHLTVNESWVESSLTGTGDLGAAFGKLSSVLVLSSLGPRVVLSGCMLLAGAASLTVAAAGRSVSQMLLRTCWFVVRLCSSFVWSAATQTLAAWADASMLGRLYGLGFGIFNDGGAALTSEAYGVILDHYEPGDARGWQTTFVVGGTLTALCGLYTLGCLIDSATTAGFAPPAPFAYAEEGCERASAELQHETRKQRQQTPSTAGRQEEHPLLSVSLAQALRTFATSASCWSLAIASIGFFVIASSVGGYVNVYAIALCGASNVEAATIRSMASVGMLLGSWCAGLAADGLSRRAQAQCSYGTVALGICSYGWWLCLHLTGTVTVSSLSVACFINMFCINWHWCVTVGLFCIRYGGPSYSGTLVALLDAISFFAGVPASFALGDCVAEGNYTIYVIVAFLATVVGLGATIAFVFLDDGQPPRDLAGPAHVAKALDQP